jgi:hypothetical protein
MLQSLFISDMATMVSMLVLASLSQRLGEALKIPPYYRVLFVTTAVVFVAFGLDTFRETLNAPLLQITAIAMRAVATSVAVVVSLRYWRWVFSEFFGRGR